MFRNWVIDATMGVRDGFFCFVPLKGDLAGECKFVFGMNFLSRQPPKGGKLMGIIHADGQEAADKFYEEHKTELEAMKK